MSFTTVVVEGTFKTSAGQSATGTLTFTLTQPMVNSDVSVQPSPIIVTLNGSGHFSTTLYANDDEGTLPQGVQYGVTEQITGAQPRDYFILVSHSTNPVDISTLMPGEPGWA